MPDPILATLRALGATGVRKLEQAIVASSRAVELTYTRDNGKTVVIPLVSMPVVLSEADFVYLHKTCLTLQSAFVRAVQARRDVPEVRALLAVDPAEEEWLALAPPGIAPLVCRWDMNIDPARGARHATLFELNGCAIGGIHYAPRSSEILLEHVGMLANGHLAVPDAMADLWADVLAVHVGDPSPRMCWLEDRSWDSGITEGPSLVKELAAAGQTAMVADPRQLDLDGAGRLVCAGQELDVVYRSIEIRDFVEIEAGGVRLDALREAFRRGRVISPPEGDLDHKSLFEIFSSKRFARLFTPAERAVLRRHVPWTRLLGERKTEGPDGQTIDLASFTRRQRRRLVIKPNRSCGGEGILIGAETRPPVWERALARAVSGKEPAVVQARIQSARLKTPASKAGRLRTIEHYTTFGVMVSSRGVGILGRAAPFSVVNVSRGGGLLGVLVRPSRGRPSGRPSGRR
jgi:hypothetical protein